MCLGKCKGMCKSKRPECKNKQEEYKIDDIIDLNDNLDEEVKIVQGEESSEEEKYDSEEI